MFYPPNRRRGSASASVPHSDDALVTEILEILRQEDRAADRGDVLVKVLTWVLVAALGAVVIFAFIVSPALGLVRVGVPVPRWWLILFVVLCVLGMVGLALLHHTMRWGPPTVPFPLKWSRIARESAAAHPEEHRRAQALWTAERERERADMDEHERIEALQALDRERMRRRARSGR